MFCTTSISEKCLHSWYCRFREFKTLFEYRSCAKHWFKNLTILVPLPLFQDPCMMQLVIEKHPKLIPVVKIFASKMSISWSWPNFKNSILNCQNGNIKCSSAQIKDQNVTFGIFLFIKTICYRVKINNNIFNYINFIILY